MSLFPYTTLQCNPTSFHGTGEGRKQAWDWGTEGKKSFRRSYCVFSAPKRPQLVKQTRPCACTQNPKPYISQQAQHGKACLLEFQAGHRAWEEWSLKNLSGCTWKVPSQRVQPGEPFVSFSLGSLKGVSEASAPGLSMLLGLSEEANSSLPPLPNCRHLLLLSTQCPTPPTEVPTLQAAVINDLRGSMPVNLPFPKILINASSLRYYRCIPYIILPQQPAVTSLPEGRGTIRPVDFGSRIVFLLHTFPKKDEHSPHRHMK